MKEEKDKVNWGCVGAILVFIAMVGMSAYQGARWILEFVNWLRQ